MSEDSSVDHDDGFDRDIRFYINSIGTMPSIEDSQLERARVIALMEICRALRRLGDRVQDAFFSFVTLNHKFERVLKSKQQTDDDEVGSKADRGAAQ